LFCRTLRVAVARSPQRRRVRIPVVVFSGSLGKMRQFRACYRGRRGIAARTSSAGSLEPRREGTRGGPGGRQIRNEFFCFEHPAKRATREKTIPDCYPTVVSRGEPRRAAERRGKRAKRPFASAKPFLQPCMQPPRESQTRHTYANEPTCV
jgi:hypothetical protein